jgi:hypothetical protein
MNTAPAVISTESPSRLHPLALVSLISGLLAWTVAPFLGAIVAIVTGHLARRELPAIGPLTSGPMDSNATSTDIQSTALQPPVPQQGRALATIGLWLGWIQLAFLLLPGLSVLLALAFVLWVVLAISGLCTIF